VLLKKRGETKVEYVIARKGRDLKRGGFVERERKKEFVK